MDMCHYVIDTIDIYREPRRRGHTDLVHRVHYIYVQGSMDSCNRARWLLITGGGGGIVRKSLLLIDSTV